MTPPSSPRPPTPAILKSTSSTRASGYALIALSAASVLLMAMHPTTGTPDFAEFVVRAGRGVPGNTLVHGSLITLIVLMAVCILSMRDALGADRWLVRAGTASLVVGSAGAIGAGLINGFVVPNTASHFIDAGANSLSSLRPSLTLAHEASATLARLATVGLSIAAVAWSTCLLRLTRIPRTCGIVGLICGIAPLALHAAEHMQVNVTGFSLLVQIHAVWTGAAGVTLVCLRIESLQHPTTLDRHQ